MYQSEELLKWTDELYGRVVASKMGSGESGDGREPYTPEKRFSYFHYIRWHNLSAHRCTGLLQSRVVGQIEIPLQVDN